MCCRFRGLAGLLRIVRPLWWARQAGILAALSACLAAQEVPKDILRTVAEVRRLSPEEAVRPYRVRVNVMVTHWNPATLDLFVQDATEGIFVAALSPAMPVKVGQWMTVEGIVAPGGHSRVIARPIFRPMDAPEAKVACAPTTVAHVLTGREDARWIEVRGVAQPSLVQEKPVVFWLRSMGQKIQVVVARVQPDFDLASLRNAEVRVRGVCSTSITPAGELDAVQVLVNDSTDLTIERGAGLAFDQLPARRAADLVAEAAEGVPDHAVCLEGRLERRTDPGYWSLADATGTVPVKMEEAHRVRPGYETRAVGFPARMGSTLILEDNSLQQFAVRARAGAGGAATATQERVPVIADAGSLVRLPPEDAGQGLPAFLRGVVTVVDPSLQQFCVQDATGGMFVVLPAAGTRIHSGDVVEVEGKTSAGTFMPVVTETSVRVVGKQPLPAPLPLSHGDLLSGVFDGQWVSVEGVIHTYWRDQDYLWLALAISGARMVVRIPLAGELDNPAGWVDARARVTGALDVVPNARRQPQMFQLLCASTANVTLLKRAARTEPPLRRIRNVGRAGPIAERDHRIRVQGRATQRDAGMGIFLRDESGSIGVRMAAAASAPLKSGDELEVVGFVGRGEYSDVLEDAVCRKLASGGPPEPMPATPAQAAQGGYDQEFIRVEGEVLNHYGDRITLQHDGVLFEARLSSEANRNSGSALPRTTRVALAGVCLTEADAGGQPRGFRLLVAGDEGVSVISRPSWWTVGKVLWALGVVACLATLALGWAAILRYQVRERTRQSKESLALFEASLTQSPSGIIIADAPAMKVRWANPAALSLQAAPAPQAGEPEPAALSARWHGFHPDGTPYKADELPLARAILRNEVTRGKELIFRNVQGENRWVSVNAAPIHDGRDAVTAGIMVLHDITHSKAAEEERKRLQDQLLQAQKMESVGRLAGGVAHDFNNMLQAILGNVDLALEDAPTEGRLQDDLREIQHAAQRSADLTRQLLAFARRQTASPQVLQLNDTLAGMLKMLQRLIGENLQLAWFPGPGLWLVKIDPAQLDQVLANLTVNARDAIQGVGRISIETANVTLDEVYAASHPECVPGEYVQLAISDTGCGMTPEVQAHLFEPFFTTKPTGQGTGLGLATVYGIVKQNGGCIQVYSEPGRGSTFKVYLPRSTEAAPSRSAAARRPAPRGSETVLLVEDEPQVLSLGQRILERQGYQVLAARDPGEALALARQHAGPLHLLVTDVVMPGMNGRELRDQVARLRPGVKSLFMSGYTADVIAHQGVIEAGVVFLQKPFSSEALAEKVRQALEDSA